MYNDDALLPLDKFEIVAKEYNKTLKAKIFNADENLSNQTSKNFENILKTLKDLQNISNNQKNKQKIEKIIDIIQKQYNIEDFSIKQYKIDKNTKKITFCEGVKYVILSLAKMKDQLSYDFFLLVLDKVCDLITPCKFRRE